MSESGGKGKKAGKGSILFSKAAASIRVRLVIQYCFEIGINHCETTVD